MCNCTLASSETEMTTDSMSFFTVSRLQKLHHQQSPQLVHQKHIQEKTVMKTETEDLD